MKWPGEAAVVVVGAGCEVLVPEVPAVVVVLDVEELPQAASDKMVPTASVAIIDVRRDRPDADRVTV